MSGFDYGNDITYNSSPDYDTLVPFDSAWDCEDWRLYYEALRNEYGSTEARRLWNDAWSKNGHLSDVLSCKYSDSWRNWADSRGLEYDHLLLGQVDSWLYDTGSNVGSAVTGVGGAVSWLGKNLKYIVMGVLVFGGLYAYKNFIKGDDKIKFR